MLPDIWSKRKTFRDSKNVKSLHGHFFIPCMGLGKILVSWEEGR